jgi:hypothetical protein
MSKSIPKASVKEALVFSILAGLAAALCGGVLVLTFYIFVPSVRLIVSRNVKELLIAAAVVFGIGFAATLESALWVGSWGKDR